MRGVFSGNGADLFLYRNMCILEYQDSNNTRVTKGQLRYSDIEKLIMFIKVIVVGTAGVRKTP